MADRRNRARLAGIVAGVAMVLIAHSARPGAQSGREPVIRLSETVGPPTTSVVVEGSGFPTGPVVLYFDRDRVGTISTQPGQFSARVNVPESALPGIHAIKAVAQTSGQTTPVSAQTPFQVHTNWPQAGFNSSHTGYNGYENVIGPQNASGLTAAWITNPPDLTFLSASPAVVNDRLYIGWYEFPSDYNSVGAFDVKTGAKLWQASYLDAIQGSSSPAVANDLVYVAAHGGALYAFDAQTGITKWQATTSLVTWNESHPVTDGPRVYQSTGPCNLEQPPAGVQARDALTGSFIWSQSIGTCAVGSPAVAGGKLYVIGTVPQDDEKRLYAFNAATGAPIWAVDLDASAYGMPVVAGGRVYVNSYFKIKIYDALNGNALPPAYLPVSDHAGLGSPAVAYGKIFVGTETGKVVALDVTSGNKVWSTAVPFLTGRVDSSAAVANGVVYVQGFAVTKGDTDVVAAFDADTGVSLFVWATDNKIPGYQPWPRGSVAVVNGRAFVGSDDARIFAFKLP